MYKCVKSNSNSDVIAIAYDENQVGNYLDLGIWQDFTFASMPEISQEVLDWAMTNEFAFLFKIVDNNIVAKVIGDF